MTESDSSESSSDPDDQRYADRDLCIVGSFACCLPPGLFWGRKPTYISPAVIPEVGPSDVRHWLYHPAPGRLQLPGLYFTPFVP